MPSAKEIEAFGDPTSRNAQNRQSAAQPQQQQQQPFEPYRPTSLYQEDIPDESPPPYGEVSIENDAFSGAANVTNDGRINVNINSASLRFAEFLAPTIRNQLNDNRPDRPVTIHKSKYADEPPAYIPPGLGPSPEGMPPPSMNVVIQIVGSRGDVQPFIALGKVLKDYFKHRVRIATHPNFQQFVEENGLEFFCIGGDPAELMAFMVKNPGLIPGMDSLTSGEVGRRRKGISEMIEGSWRSCFEPGDGTGEALRPKRKGEAVDGAEFELAGKPFVADVIIANPPSFAHIHVAEKLGIPLHLMFTMPWSPTRAFPHPLANIQSSNVGDIGTANTVTYAMVEMLTWQGLSDVINKFRVDTLELPPLDIAWTPGLVNRLQIPYTYCWSPALIPKPSDWGQHIDISGFFMLNLASNYTPPDDLDAFLKAGPPPVYIGFGSIVIDDPNALTDLIFEAVGKAGVRAIVSKGWGGLGGDSLQIPQDIFMLGNCPHDWLFKRVSTVVHHGGAGTSSAGIHAGVPTVVVPFFGDQPFWGAMIARAGAGPNPIPFPKLTADKLAEALTFCARDDIKAQAEELGAKIREEKGTLKGAESFHKHLYYEDLRCAIVPSKAAVWRTRNTNIRLSAMAATLLVRDGILQWNDLKMYRPRDYNTEAEPWEPFSGVTASFINDFATMAYAMSDLPFGVIKAGLKRNSNGKESEKTSGAATPTGPMSCGALKPNPDDKIQPVPPIPASFDHRPPSADSSSTRSFPRKPVPSRQSTADSSSPNGPLSPPYSTTSTLVTPSMPPRSMTSMSNSSITSSFMERNKGKEKVSRTAAFEASIEAGRGLGRIAAIGAKSPMNMSLGLAKGFRNAPKLYNDPTVRESEKVTSFASGLKVAGKEFGLGFYDGVVGLVRNPYEGAKSGGRKGLVKGIGKGLGGFLLKPASAIWALPAYTFQGVYMEMKGKGSKTYQAYIDASRLAQGQEELMHMTLKEEQEMIIRWKAVEQEAYKKKKSRSNISANSLFLPRSSTSTSMNSSTSGMASPSVNGSSSSSASYMAPPPAESYPHQSQSQQGLAQQARNPENWSRFYNGDEKASLAAADAEANGDAASMTTATSRGEESPSLPLRTSTQSPGSPTGSMFPSAWADYSREELNAVVAEAVRQTSRGDAEEDAAIEQVIRENVREMKRQGGGGNTGVRHSLIENMNDQEYQSMIDRVIRENIVPAQAVVAARSSLSGERSLAVEEVMRQQGERDGIEEGNERARAEEEEDEYQRVLRLSMAETSGGPMVGEEEADLERILEESKKAAMKKEQEDKAQNERDEILLEYIKQESIAMEEYRQQQRG